MFFSFEFFQRGKKRVKISRFFYQFSSDVYCVYVEHALREWQSLCKVQHIQTSRLKFSEISTLTEIFSIEIKSELHSMEWHAVDLKLTQNAGIQQIFMHSINFNGKHPDVIRLRSFELFEILKMAVHQRPAI